jgi:hypothetical protein
MLLRVEEELVYFLRRGESVGGLFALAFFGCGGSVLTASIPEHEHYLRYWMEGVERACVVYSIIALSIPTFLTLDRRSQHITSTSLPYIGQTSIRFHLQSVFYSLLKSIKPSSINIY